MEEKTQEELEAEKLAAKEVEKAEFEKSLEGLSVEEKAQKIKEAEDAAKAKDIDYKKDLENLEGSKPQKSELEKARNALFFNAKRFAELGGDPTEVLPKPKVEVKGETDVRAVVEQTLAEKEARKLAKTDDEYNVIMWRVRNQGLSVEEAHLLANKGRYLKLESELKRADVKIGQGGGAGQKIVDTKAPVRSPEDVALLNRRGLKLNPKTQTYQGKHTEEYWDGEKWATRKRTS